MTTFVLVHGAWNGAHGMRLVRRRLQAHGHEVFTPSLTGIGERVHLAGPQVDLTTHVHDVVNTILYEDLTEIVLLGFSYGGMVVTGALDHVGDRVRHLVLLDAFVPDDGDSVRSLLGAGPPPPIALGEPWAVPPTVRRYDDPEEAAFATRPLVAPPGRVLHRARPPVAPARGVALQPHLRAGERRRPRRPGHGRVRGRRRPGEGLAGLALRRDRHQPHDRRQPSGRARRTAPRPG